MVSSWQQGNEYVLSAGLCISQATQHTDEVQGTKQGSSLAPSQLSVCVGEPYITVTPSKESLLSGSWNWQGLADSALIGPEVQNHLPQHQCPGLN